MIGEYPNGPKVPLIAVARPIWHRKPQTGRTPDEVVVELLHATVRRPDLVLTLDLEEARQLWTDLNCALGGFVEPGSESERRLFELHPVVRPSRTR